MDCGGFACSRNALCALNLVYMLVRLLLISVAAWGKGLELVSSIYIIRGVITVYVFLLLIAVVALIGATQSLKCQVYGAKFLKHSDEALKILGHRGLFLSFTEILGVCLAMRFWNQKDLRANPSAFL
uniref:Uncharacterized protein n=1 Tax=Vombatus ursinus TaxID=29139 RepID=A0A4X2KGR9_VOMUR